MQPWTEALPKRLLSGSVHAGLCPYLLIVILCNKIIKRVTLVLPEKVTKSENVKV